MGMLENWKGALTEPRDTFASEKKKATLSGALMHIAVPSVIIGLLVGAVFAFVGSLLSFIPGAGWLGALGIAAIIIMPIAFLAGFAVFQAVYVGIMHLVAGALGGKGGFTQLYYLNAMIFAPVFIISALLGIIPLLGALLSVLLWIYSLYLTVLAVKEVHSLGTEKAVLVWLSPAIILIVLQVLFGRWL